MANQIIAKPIKRKLIGGPFLIIILIGIITADTKTKNAPKKVLKMSGQNSERNCGLNTRRFVTTCFLNSSGMLSAQRMYQNKALVESKSNLMAYSVIWGTLMKRNLAIR